MKAITRSFSFVRLAKFWAISSLITVGSVYALPDLINSMSDASGTSDYLWLSLTTVIAMFGTCLLPFAIWQKVQRDTFFLWLEENWNELEKGAMHPEGHLITLDTKLVRYDAVFSAILATVSLESRPYVLKSKHAGLANTAYTLLSTIFGWWFMGPDGVVGTVKAIYHNALNKRVFTLRELQEAALAE
jgi:hypothetical protein